MGRFSTAVVRLGQLFLGAGIASYLIFHEVPYVTYCEWLYCSVRMNLHWYQPILFAVAAHLLCLSFWKLCMSTKVMAFERDEYPIPSEFPLHQSPPMHYTHFDVHLG